MFDPTCRALSARSETLLPAIAPGWSKSALPIQSGGRDASMWLFDRAHDRIADLASPRALASALLDCAEIHEARRSARLALEDVRAHSLLHL